ncbi:hypothetical protein QJQ45_023094, partial [Haematococcus lacustris]
VVAVVHHNQVRTKSSTPEPVLNLLHRGYKSVVTDSTSLTSHKRQYNGDCELVKLNWKQFFNIAKAKLHDVTRGVTIPAEEAMLMRMAAAGVEAAQVGKIIPVRTEAELNARYGFVVGTGVADVVNACMKQKQPTWKEVSFHVQGSPCEGSGRPDFMIKQTGAGGGHGEVDVCGGEGEASPQGSSFKPFAARRLGWEVVWMPSVVYQPILHLTDMQGGVGDMLMQACSYCQEKGWRFTFVTTHLLTFIIWRVAEDKYAVTNGILYDADPYDLFAREALACQTDGTRLLPLPLPLPLLPLLLLLLLWTTGFSHCSELWHQINHLQLGSGESISQLCSRLSDLVLELAEADETVSEAVQVRALLQAVPSLPPYDMAREFITQGADASAPSLADVKRRLQNAEARVRNQQPAQLAAIHAPRRSSASPTSSSSRHSAAKPGADPSSSSPSPTALSRVKCFKCGKRGHIARDCKEPGGSSSSGSSSGGGGGSAGGGAGGGSGAPGNRGADKGRAASSATAGLFHAKLMAMQAVPSSGASGSGGASGSCGASGSSGSKGGAVHNGAAGGGAGGEVQCCWSHAAGLSSLYPCVSAKPTPSLAAAAQVAPMPRSSGLLSSERFWLADSGASHHITPDRSLLHDFQAVEQPVSLALGKNTARLVAHGVGNVRLVSESGQCFTLRGVLWAPDAAANYLSTVVADLAGWRVVQEGGGIRIEDRANPARFCVKGALVGRSYLIRCSAEPAVVGCEPPATAHAVTAETPQLLHERLGHLSYGAMADLIGKGMVSGVSISAAQCKAAGSGVCPGYVVTFLDEYSGLSLVKCVKAKSDVPGVIISTVQWLETQSGRKLKALRSDNGTSTRRSGPFWQARAFSTSGQRPTALSRMAERLNRTLIEKVRCMLYTAGLPARLWTEAVRTANHLRNLSPMRGKGATPWELFFGVKPDISALRVFGATAYALCLCSAYAQHMRSKLEGKAVQGVLVGYEMCSKAYKVAEVMATAEELSVHTPVAEPGLEPETGGAGGEAVGADSSGGDSGAGSAASAGGGGASASAAEPAACPVPLRQSLRLQGLPPAGSLAACVLELPAAAVPIPHTIMEARASALAEQWAVATDAEMESLHGHCTWELVDPPQGCRPLDNRWVFPVKEDSQGHIARLKARLVVKGFMLREGVDFTELHAPVSKHATVRALLATAAVWDMDLEHLDVKTAFLNGYLDEEIYMKQPAGYEDGSARVCRLKRALYGLRQAPRAWHARLKAELEQLGFAASAADSCLFTMVRGNSKVLLAVYVDDCLLALGSAERFLGMEIVRDRAAGRLVLSQERYAAAVVDRFGLADARPKATPLSTSEQLVREGEVVLRMGEHSYAELVGSLMHLAVCTRPDIAHAVGLCAKYMAAPTQQHWQALHGVLRYVASTVSYGLAFGGAEGLVGFCDADFAGDLDTRRSTTGFVFTMHGAAVSWSSRRQPTVAVSTTEAEYMAASAAAKEALWLRVLLADLSVGSAVEPVTIMCDNEAAITLIKHPIASARSKHIDVLHHFVRERAARGELVFKYLASGANVADAMTKALPGVKFEFCKSDIIWMSLEAPWGTKLPAGQLQELETKLKGQAAVAVLHGRPKERQGQGRTGKRSASTCKRSARPLSGTPGRAQRQRKTAARSAVQRRDQPGACWTAIEDAPEHPLASLQLSSTSLGTSQCGLIVQGRLRGVPVAVKVTDACKSSAVVQLLWHEAQIYGFLQELQGHLLPVLHGSGYWRGRNSFFLATAVVPGEPVDGCTDAAAVQAAAQAAQQALQAIHQRGVAHGDVCKDNILVQHPDGSDLQVVFIGFGHAYLDPSPEQCERELAQLARVFRPLLDSSD